MITRRILLGGAVGTGVLALTPTGAARATGAAEARNGIHEVSATGWRIDPATIGVHRIEGSTVSVALRHGPTAVVLLHVARRWHYEIGPVDTGEGGGVAGYVADRAEHIAFESNYLSGTAIALHPTAYPLGGSEPLWPHQEAVVRDILADCEGTVAWGGDLSPVTSSHFHITARPGDRALTRVAARLGSGVHVPRRTPTVVAG
ncbi:hypothetical protein O7543_08610 [Solwaraspora sp. WMMA2080]|uniref:hypothetical protein n=1 Tax=unclassified Solwaraspora TaxID=2627926 RepID=UPI00248C9AA1|nr:MULTISPECIES: hypothetical protein [unclassified Solwaraspora]WBB98955.1 hypothetical protein O7553_08755 [Solwaraspora sp. WMMA2059]WBC22492.1 hypothetical protein O7543_08610 [Solwaraspora sp. WMMA2080]